MGFPAMDLAISRKPVAALITGVNEIKFISMKKILNGFFVDKDYGVFMTDPTKALRYDRTPIYFYDIRSAKPIQMLAMKEVQNFVDGNGLTRITPKDAKHGEWLRRISLKHGGDTKKALEELKTQEQDAEHQVHNEIEAINMQLMEQNQQLAKEEKPPLKIDPDDYAGYVIEALVSKGLVTRGEAARIRFNLVSGEITIDDFIRQLEELHKIEVHHPITANAQHFIDDFKTFDPARVMAYIKGAKGLGKDIKELGQPAVRNLIPAMWIVLVCVGVGIMAILLTSVDWGNVIKLIPFLNKG